MKKTIDIGILDLEEDDMICGYRIKDLIITAETMKKEQLTPLDLRKFVNNLEFAYKVISNEMQRQISSSLKTHIEE